MLPDTNTVMGLKVYNLMKQNQSALAIKLADVHCKKIHALCEKCQEGVYTQCSSCLHACTRPQPGDRVYNDWVTCGACDGCRANLQHLDNCHSFQDDDSTESID